MINSKVHWRLLVSLVAVLLVSCATTGRLETRSTLVTHIVVCWLKNPGDSAARAQLIERSGSFRVIPGVVNITAGEPLASSRLTVDSSFDVAVVMTFVDEAALRAYEKHPLHQKAVQEVLKPLVRRFVVHDFAAPQRR